MKVIVVLIAGLLSFVRGTL